MGTILALILVCQAGINRPAAALDIPDFPDADPALQAVYQEHELMRRYNALVSALNDFVSAYKVDKIDLKKAKAVRKALHDMEKFEWFRRAADGAATDADK
jgi:hypothetical protein